MEAQRPSDDPDEGEQSPEESAAEDGGRDTPGADHSAQQTHLGLAQPADAADGSDLQPVKLSASPETELGIRNQKKKQRKKNT